MSQQNVLTKALGASTLSLVFIALPAAGQQAASDADMSNRASSTGSAGASASPDSSQTRSAGGSGTVQLNEQDRELIQDIAHANLAEIETGKMALEKSEDPQIKKFAQMMIDDHTKAMKELQNLAQKKGITLPNETDIQHKTIALALQALNGETFNEQYISRVGVGSHERTLGLLQKTQKEAKDQDLKAYATKTIKPVSRHLDQARKLDKKK